MAEYAAGPDGEGGRHFWNVVKIINGTVLAQLAMLAAMPLLSRLYRPQDFSAFLVFSSMLSYVMILANLRYEVAIVQEKDEEAARDVWLLCCFINVLLTGLAFVAILALTSFDFLGSSPALRQIVWLLPPAIFLCGMQNSLNYLTTRKQAFNVVSIASAARGFATSAAAVGLGLTSAGGAGLAAADLLGRLGGIALMLRAHADANWRCPRSDLYARLRVMATRHRALPLFSLPSAIFNNIGGTLTPLLMVAVFDATTSGQFALIERGVAMPLGLLVQSSSQVFAPAFVKALGHGEDAATQIFRKFIAVHFLIALAPCAILLFFAPQIFSVVFGPNWGMAAEMTRFMAPMLLLGTAMGPVGMALTLMGLQRLQLAWDLARLGLLTAVWALALVMRLDAYKVVQLYTLAMCLSIVVLAALAHYRLLARERAGRQTG
jgi:O-antigen/teichoic acid export membrane protein